jgi:hypothetical protein
MEEGSMLEGRLILKWTSDKQGAMMLDSFGSRQGEMLESCHHHYEPVGSIKGKQP